MDNNNVPAVNENEVMVVSSAESLAALNRSEIDCQIATAKQYPRVLSTVLKNIEAIATLDKDTAAACFYSVPRGGKNITGPSIRLAEIVASEWGNLRVQARIIANDGKTITAQGVCHDLEKNNAFSVEVKTKITDRNGRTFSEDMQVIAGNAACAKAMRNALFKTVPAALLKGAIDKARLLSVGQGVEFEETRKKMIEWYESKGITKKRLFDFLSVKDEADVTPEMVIDLRGMATAVTEGTVTIEEIFSPKLDEKKAKEVAGKFANFNNEEDKTK